MVTLLGFFFIIGNVILIEIYMPDLVGPVRIITRLGVFFGDQGLISRGIKGPSWLYYSFAFGMWMYSTLDNVDGKQARRTGTSSGLGELFELVQNRQMHISQDANSTQPWNRLAELHYGQLAGNCGNGLRFIAARRMDGPGSLLGNVLLDLGDIPHSYAVSGLFQRAY